MSEKESSPASTPGRTKAYLSTNKKDAKAHKAIGDCFECAYSVMKLRDGEAINYCLTYTEPCQEAIKICEVA